MARPSILARLLRDSGGNTFAIFAAALVPLLALLGGGLDLGVRYMAAAKLQNACDAGALAARQAMVGDTWDINAEAEGAKFFAFNFPQGTHGTTNVRFAVAQNASDTTEVLGQARTSVPTSLMRIFGITELPITATCDAKRDMGHNDIVMVLDVTGSMNGAPTGGGSPKIARLRNGAAGLYKALSGNTNSITRFGIVPYSQTVNVGRWLSTDYFLRDQQFVAGEWTYDACEKSGSNWICTAATSSTRPSPGMSQGNTKNIKNVRYQKAGFQTIGARDGSWPAGTDAQAIDLFRVSGDACIEERPSSGNAATPVAIRNSLALADVDARPSGSADIAHQFGRYDPALQTAAVNGVCPSEAVKLRTFANEAAFTSAIAAATARVSGTTYHDVGMLWGLRFISRNGFFGPDNPEFVKNVPVNPHIVFMTDGIMNVTAHSYSAHGIETYQNRTKGSGSQFARHVARFQSVCNLAKSMGVTVWVIALDVTNADDVKPCATSSAHFYASDGSDLEQVFAAIGQGIGDLRLTR